MASCLRHSSLTHAAYTAIMERPLRWWQALLPLTSTKLNSTAFHFFMEAIQQMRTILAQEDVMFIPADLDCLHICCRRTNQGVVPAAAVLGIAAELVAAAAATATASKLNSTAFHIFMEVIQQMRTILAQDEAMFIPADLDHL